MSRYVGDIESEQNQFNSIKQLLRVLRKLPLKPRRELLHPRLLCMRPGALLPWNPRGYRFPFGTTHRSENHFKRCFCPPLLRSIFRKLRHMAPSEERTECRKWPRTLASPRRQALQIKTRGIDSDRQCNVDSQAEIGSLFFSPAVPHLASNDATLSSGWTQSVFAHQRRSDLTLVADRCSRETYLPSFSLTKSPSFCLLILRLSASTACVSQCRQCFFSSTHSL